ncbi:hypothetical protein F4604DRAFT_1689567 [Suillus subluteus]|nr:hypothetical protein F4604DRAFT_1689567 [Suillus subluteus]
MSMDFARLDYILDRIALHRRWPVERVLEAWLESWQASNTDGWRDLDGIPCVMGGLTVLLKNMLMPSETCDTLVKSKGIHDLTLRERRVLGDALKNNTLTVKHTTTNAARARLLASCGPIIIGETPESGSRNSCGRHMFANGRIDKQGLARLKEVASPMPSSTTSPTPSRQQRLQVFIDVPIPSWRLVSRCSPSVRRPDSRELIPPIVTINQTLPLMDGATKDEGLDELFTSLFGSEGSEIAPSVG